MNKSAFFYTFCLCVMITLSLTACSKEEKRNNTQNIVSQQNNTTKPVDAVQNKTMPKVYQEFIDGKIKQVLFENDELEGFNYMPDDMKAENIYITLKDIDNNGTDELIIGFQENSDYGQIIALYTIDNNNQIKLIESGDDRNQLYLLNNDKFYQNYRDNAFVSTQGIYHLAGDKLLADDYCFTAPIYKKNGQEVDFIELGELEDNQYEIAEFYNKTGENNIKNSQRTTTKIDDNGVHNKDPLCTFDKHIQKLEKPILSEISKEDSKENKEEKSSTMKKYSFESAPKPDMSLKQNDSKEIRQIKQQYNEVLQKINNHHNNDDEIRKYSILVSESIPSEEKIPYHNEYQKMELLFVGDIFFGKEYMIGSEATHYQYNLFNQNGDLIFTYKITLSVFGDSDEYYCYYKNNKLIHTQSNYDGYGEDMCKMDKQYAQKQKSRAIELFEDN
ncbi:MAG: hypothetical protein J6M43_03155 [Neisseriaceae bacterium]|nr:hypothetical protein [Neisseriaceae bacterium]